MTQRYNQKTRRPRIALVDGRWYAFAAGRNLGDRQLLACAISFCNRLNSLRK